MGVDRPRSLVRRQVSTCCVVGWESERSGGAQCLVSVLWQRMHEWLAVVRLSQLLPVYPAACQRSFILARSVHIFDSGPIALID